MADKPLDKSAESCDRHYQPLVQIAIAAAVGIVVDRYSSPAISWWGTLAIASLVAWLILWRKRWDRTSAVIVLLATCVTAGAWHHCCWSLFADDDIGNFARDEAQPVAIEAIARNGGRIVPAAKFDPLCVLPQQEHTRIEVAVTRIRDGKKWRCASGLAELYIAGSLTNIRAGDRLRIFARLIAPAPAMNPGQFDYAQYLRADRHRAVLLTNYPQAITVIEPGAMSLTRLIDTAREYSLQALRKYVASSRLGLAAAVLLGAREQLDPGVTEACMETGTIHFLVIAGVHVGVLAGAVWLVLSRLRAPPGLAVMILASLMGFYALVVGMEPPVVRATIFVFCSGGALILGRQRQGFNALAAGALIVLVMNPTDLFNTGAQLSFLSVAGLLAWGERWLRADATKDPLQRVIDQSRAWPVCTAIRMGRVIWQLVMVSTLITVIALPLVMARFHVVAVVGPILSTLLWIPLEGAMLSGITLIILGWIPWVGAVCGRCCNAFLWLMEMGITMTRSLPGSHFWVSGPPDWWLIGFYGALAAAALFPSRVPPRRWCAALLGAWIAIGLTTAHWHRPHDSLDCTILSVGHGGATVIELPSGQTLLYDIGQMSAPHSSARTVASYLWSRGIMRLDTVMLSHADVDHFNGLPELLTQFSVRAIYVPPLLWNDRNLSIALLHEAVIKAGIEIHEMHAGDRLNGGPGCVLESFHPPAGGVADNSNANSLVLGISYQGHRILLPGDLESPGLDQLLTKKPWPCDVLMAPHHGSRRGQSPRLVAWCQPKSIVISGNRGKDFHEVEAFYKTLNSNLFHTARCGAVMIHIDPAGLTVHGFREN